MFGSFFAFILCVISLLVVIRHWTHFHFQQLKCNESLFSFDIAELLSGIRMRLKLKQQKNKNPNQTKPNATHKKTPKRKLCENSFVASRGVFGFLYCYRGLFLVQLSVSFVSSNFSVGALNTTFSPCTYIR